VEGRESDHRLISYHSKRKKRGGKLERSDTGHGRKYIFGQSTIGKKGGKLKSEKCGQEKPLLNQLFTQGRGGAT